MRVDFTVAIPTYNGAERLPDVLDALRSQTQTETINWEILVVDNCSTDQTAEVVKEYQNNWKFPFPLKYTFEGQQGADYARKRAILESKAPLIGFLDDDNIPEKEWVMAAVKFAKNYPKSGAYGSQIHGKFEGKLPDNFARIKPYFAITEWGDKPRQYYSWSKLVPPSAGLVIRRKAWLETVPQERILKGRVEGNMLTSEDTEALAYLLHSPWEIWYNPAMVVVHKIPKQRLEPEYLISFIRGIGLSRYVVRMVGIHPLLKPAVTLAYMANDLRKLIRHLIKYQTKVKTDLVAACEIELYRSCLQSPFYFWKQGYLK